jgi:hypothetical protein
MCKAILDGIKPPLTSDVKELVMMWVASESTTANGQAPNTEQDLQQQRQAPSHPAQESLVADPRSQRTLAEFCIRISCDVKWPNDPAQTPPDE